VKTRKEKCKNIQVTSSGDNVKSKSTNGGVSIISNSAKGSSIPEGFLKLSDAAKLCSYSQEYLSLLARRHELKAEKFGRNWYTRQEWLDVYVYKHSVLRKGNVKGELVKDKVIYKKVSKSSFTKLIREFISINLVKVGSFFIWILNFIVSLNLQQRIKSIINLKFYSQPTKLCFYHPFAIGFNKVILESIDMGDNSYRSSILKSNLIHEWLAKFFSGLSGLWFKVKYTLRYWGIAPSRLKLQIGSVSFVVVLLLSFQILMRVIPTIVLDTTDDVTSLAQATSKSIYQGINGIVMIPKYTWYGTRQASKFIAKSVPHDFFNIKNIHSDVAVNPDYGTENFTNNLFSLFGGTNEITGRVLASLDIDNAGELVMPDELGRLVLGASDKHVSRYRTTISILTNYSQMPFKLAQASADNSREVVRRQNEFAMSVLTNIGVGFFD